MEEVEQHMVEVVLVRQWGEEWWLLRPLLHPSSSLPSPRHGLVVVVSPLSLPMAGWVAGWLDY